MTLLELSVEYREHARMLDLRICQLEAVLERTRNEKQRLVLEHRIHMLSTMLAGRADQGAVHHAAGGQRTGCAHRALL